MTRSRKCLIFVLAGLLLAGAVNALGDEKVASLAPFLGDAPFGYRKTVIQPSNHMEEKLETSKYRVRRLSFPSIGRNGQDENVVTSLYYQSKLPGKKRLVIVLPIWGTHTYPPRKMTKSLLAYSHGEMMYYGYWVRSSSFIGKSCVRRPQRRRNGISTPNGWV